MVSGAIIIIIIITRRHGIVITLSWYQYRILAILLKSIYHNPVAYFILLFGFLIDVYVLILNLLCVHCAIQLF